MEEVPFEDRHVPRVEIDWDRSLWWWYPISRAIQPAVRMTSLVWSWLAIVIAVGGVVLGNWLFQPRWDAESLGWLVQNFGMVRGDGLTPSVVIWLGMVFQAAATLTLGLREFAFVTFELLWLTATLGVLGGVITRRAAVELGQRTVAPWGETFRLVFGRWQSVLWSTGMHFVGIAVLLIPALLLGLGSRLGSVGAAIAGVLLLLSFPLVFSVGRFVLSALICFPLSVCAICIEKKADAFEGFSRSNAYFFQRPVVFVLCWIALAVVGVVGEQIVYWTISSGWWLIREAFRMAAAPGLNTAEHYLTAGNWLAATLIAAYWFSFFWSATAAVYLVIRKSVDNCELDQMESIESPIEEQLPEIPRTSQPLDESDGAAESSPPAADESSAS